MIILSGVSFARVRPPTVKLSALTANAVVDIIKKAVTKTVTIFLIQSNPRLSIILTLFANCQIKKSGENAISSTFNINF
jgi:hypothetical protein